MFVALAGLLPEGQGRKGITCQVSLQLQDVQHHYDLATFAERITSNLRGFKQALDVAFTQN